MGKILIEQLKDLFPNHEINHSWNESGYSDVELIIDDCWTSIWVDDYTLYLFEDDKDYQFYLEHIKSDIEHYLATQSKDN